MDEDDVEFEPIRSVNIMDFVVKKTKRALCADSARSRISRASSRAGQPRGFLEDYFPKTIEPENHRRIAPSAAISTRDLCNEGMPKRAIRELDQGWASCGRCSTSGTRGLSENVMGMAPQEFFRFYWVLLNVY